MFFKYSMFEMAFSRSWLRSRRRISPFRTPACSVSRRTAASLSFRSCNSYRHVVQSRKN